LKLINLVIKINVDSVGLLAIPTLSDGTHFLLSLR
jgi:hypothetical protein